MLVSGIQVELCHDLPIDATDDDSNVSSCQSKDKHFCLLVTRSDNLDICSHTVLLASSYSSALLDSLVSPPDVDKHQATTEDHVCHLKDDTSDEHGRSNIKQILVRIFSIRRGRRDTTACSLDDNREKIGTDENPGVQNWLDETVLATVPEDEVFECDGNRSSDQCRTENEKDKLNDESVVDPWIRTHDNATAVAYQFKDGTDRQPYHVGPCSCSNTEVYLWDESQRVGYDEKDTSAEIEVIAVEGGFDGTSF